jgi:cation diffusion facilitator family transporter
MMDACCHDTEGKLKALEAGHGRVLRMVLVINAIFFVIEFLFGILARSTALLADSLDMLGDTLVYALSLYVLSRSITWKASASIAKGIVMMAFGVGVLIQAAYKTLSAQMPVYETMGIIGMLALLANVTCCILLYQYKSDNLNMRSTWLCSRNDVIANVSVLLAAWAVFVTQSPWPDIIIGVSIALLFLKSASTVFRESLFEFRHSHIADRRPQFRSS